MGVNGYFAGFGGDEVGDLGAGGVIDLDVAVGADVEVAFESTAAPQKYSPEALWESEGIRW